MDVLHERAAGMDLSKRDAKVAIRVPAKRAGAYTSSVTTWGATASQIFELIEFLHAQQVTTVVMEATSDYFSELGIGNRNATEFFPRGWVRVTIIDYADQPVLVVTPHTG